jgi:hypothetical protein
MWTRAQRDTCAGRTVITLSPADHLVHICGHAACSASRDRLKWAADAWYLLERNPSLDWAQWIETVCCQPARAAPRGPAALPRRRSGSPVPSWVLDRLSETRRSPTAPRVRSRSRVCVPACAERFAT